MDTVCYKKRVQDTILCPPQIVSGSSSVSEKNTYRPREDLTSGIRSTIYAGQTCHRTSFFGSSEERLLQLAFSGPQEVRRMETSYRSFPTESACNHSSLQNVGLCSSFSKEARLGNFFGLDRCIFSHPNSSQVQEIPPFPFHGENISVSSPCLRFGSSSLCVFPNCEGSGKALSTHRYASSFIPRRLAPTVSVSSCVSVSQRSTSEYGVVPGICSQLGQVGASSQSEIFFPGSSFLSRQGADRSIFGQAHEATIINTENVGLKQTNHGTFTFP